ncbi:MAG: 50S ribosomal protein L33, partial [Methanocella sp.]
PTTEFFLVSAVLASSSGLQNFAVSKGNRSKTSKLQLTKFCKKENGWVLHLLGSCFCEFL